MTTRDVVIRFIACEGSPHMVQALPYCMTYLHLGEHADPALRIVGVSLDGAPRKFRLIDAKTVSVSPPIPFHCGRVAIHCLAPQEPLKLLQPHQATTPAPGSHYGLQRPTGPASRHLQ